MKENWYKSMVEDMLKFESKNSLYELKLDQYYIWGEIRKTIFYKIINKNSKSIRESKIDKIKQLLLIKNKLSKAPEADNIVFLHHKKYIINNELVDPITLSIIEELKSTGESYITSKKMFDKYDDNKYEYTTIEKIYHRHKIDKSSINEELVMICNYFNERYDLNLTIAFYNKVVNNFISDTKYYEKCYNKIKPKTIYTNMYYADTALVIAAKKLNIKVVDIQYAALIKYHIGYYYPGVKIPPYFPDELILDSENWNREYLPDVKKNIKKKSSMNTEAKKDKIVIISQDKFVEEFVKLTQSMLLDDICNKYEIVFKQHPKEKDLENVDFKVIKATNNILLEDVIKDAKYVITSYSSGAYEAFELGCKVLLLDLPLSNLVEGIDYTLIKDVQDIKAKIGE